MKILITTEFYLPFQCGITTAVINQKKTLESLGHEVRILTISNIKESEFKDDVYYIRNTIPQLYKDSYATVIFHDRLLKDIYRWKPDIVHSQCEFFTMVFAKKIARKLKIPLIHTCHTDFDAYGIHFTKNDKLWDYMTRTFIPKLLKNVDFIICPTPKNYNLLKRYGTENPMQVIPCGLDLSYLSQKLSPGDRRRMRGCYGFRDDDVVLISVCRLSEEKNVKESIGHFASLHKLRKNAKLLIVGDGTEKDALQDQVQEQGLDEVVKFAGNIPMDEIWKYYDIGDIFISSSLSEIQGLTYIEALASGLPIVCRKDAALDISLKEGVNGFSFISNEEFLHSMLPLVDDENKRKEMGGNAQETVDKFSLENFAKNLLKVYKRYSSAE